MRELIDRANEQVQRNLDAALAAQRLKTLGMTANDVMDCEECEKPIGVKRKQAVPSATRCVPCQGEYEAKERRR